LLRIAAARLTTIARICNRRSIDAMHPHLKPFVDEELSRAPLLLEEALHAALEAARQAEAPDDRRFSRELHDALNEGKARARQRFVESLREQLAEGATSSYRRSARKSLSLVDEDAVAADIELSRTTQAIKDTAEQELRELRAFTSALVGDIHVAHDTNPLRPEIHARALWAAAAALPLSSSRRVTLMRHAALPFARTLRRAYAAACTRLENAGVEPGSFRTIVEPTGKRMAVPLSQLRDTMPMPLDEPRAAPAAEPRTDRQAVALLSRLFDAMLVDSAVAADVRVLVSHLHTLAVRVALREPAALDSYTHPLWLFIDRINFMSELHPGERDPLRMKLLAFVRSLLDGLLREAVPDGHLFGRALERLRAFEQHLFELRRSVAEPAIEGLRALADPHAAPGSQVPALDVCSLDTVPAPLLEARSRPRGASRLPVALVPGRWVRVFLDGRWSTSQLVWRDISGSAWLLADVDSGASWALAHSALERLHGDGLLSELAPRSLVQAAAQAVERDLARTTH
jgi:hypothetical protein